MKGEGGMLRITPTFLSSIPSSILGHWKSKLVQCVSVCMCVCVCVVRAVVTALIHWSGGVVAADPLSKEVFGDAMFKSFVEYKRREWEEYHMHVSDWEIERYLKFF